MTEYLVIVGVIALGLTVAVSAFGDEVKRAFGMAAARLRHAPTLQIAHVMDARRPPRHSSSGSTADLARSSYMALDDSFSDHPTGKVELSWEAPTSREDGSALNNLSGYRIYFGNESGTYGLPVDIGLVTEFQLTGLEIGRTYYFAISSYDGSGNESALSNEVSKVVTPE